MRLILSPLLASAAKFRLGNEVSKPFSSMTLDELTSELVANNEDLFLSDPPSSSSTEGDLASVDRRDRDSEIPRAVGVGLSGDDYLGKLWNWVKGVAGYQVDTFLPYPLHSSNYLNQYVYERSFDPSDSRDPNVAGDVLIRPDWTPERPITWKTWSNSSSLPYRLASTDPCVRAIVTEAMARFSEATSGCVNFVETSASDPNALVISSGGDACYASLGYSKGNNILVLGNGCLNVGTAMHLLGHVLGMAHEDQRPNARDYVKVRRSNIDVFGMSSSSSIDPTETAKYPYVFEPLKNTKTDWERVITTQAYEFGSIMHNARSLYSVDVSSDFTLVGASSTQYEDLMGQRGWITERDARVINEMYSCQRLPTKVSDRTFSRPLSPGVTFDMINTCIVQDVKRFKAQYSNR
jgi:hypothetical protein